MKKAINYLKTLGIRVSKEGNIISKLPSGQKGIVLVDMLEENTMEENYCFTIIKNRLEKIEI
jgi:hypothetical protein